MYCTVYKQVGIQYKSTKYGTRAGLFSDIFNVEFLHTVRLSYFLFFSVSSCLPHIAITCQPVGIHPDSKCNIMTLKTSLVTLWTVWPSESNPVITLIHRNYLEHQKMWNGLQMAFVFEAWYSLKRLQEGNMDFYYKYLWNTSSYA